MSAITDDKALETVIADVTTLNIAGSQVGIAVAELGYYSVIKSKVQQDDAMALLKLCKDIEKAIEGRRKELVGPYNDTVKQINKYAKDLTDKLSVAIETVKGAVLSFQKEEEKKALQARTVAREGSLIQLGFTYDANQNLYKMDSVGSMTANELQHYDDISFNSILSAFTESVNRLRSQKAEQVKQVTELDNIFGDDVAEIAVADMAPIVVAPVNGYKTEAIKGTTKRWTFEVMDVNQMPREYLMVDETAIRNAINQGVRVIPGVNIFQKEGLSIR